MNIDEIRNYGQKKRIEAFEVYLEDSLSTKITYDNLSIDTEELFDRGVGIRTIEKRKLGTASCSVDKNLNDIYSCMDRSIKNGIASLQSIRNFSENNIFSHDTELKSDNIEKIKKIICNRFNISDNLVLLKHEQIRTELITFTSHIVNYKDWFELNVYNKIMNNENIFIFKNLDEIMNFNYRCNTINYCDTLIEKYDLIEISAVVNSLLLKYLGNSFLYKENDISSIIIDKKIFSEKFNLYENGEITRKDSFNKFDVEGIEKTNIKIIDRGYPKTLLYSLCDGFNKNINPTGNTVRKSYNYLPKLENHCIFQEEGNIKNYKTIFNENRILRLKEMNENTFIYNYLTADFEGLADLEYVRYGEESNKTYQMFIKGNLFYLYNRIIEIGNYLKDDMLSNNQVISPCLIVEDI